MKTQLKRLLALNLAIILLLCAVFPASAAACFEAAILAKDFKSFSTRSNILEYSVKACSCAAFACCKAFFDCP